MIPALMNIEPWTNICKCTTNKCSFSFPRNIESSHTFQLTGRTRATSWDFLSLDRIFPMSTGSDARAPPTHKDKSCWVKKAFLRTKIWKVCKVIVDSLAASLACLSSFHKTLLTLSFLQQSCPWSPDIVDCFSSRQMSIACGRRFVFLRFVKCLRAVQLVSFLVSLSGKPCWDLRRITVPRKVSFSSETEQSGLFWKQREKGIKIKRWTYAHINESMKSVILPQTLCDSHGISGCGMERESKWTEEARCSRCTGEIRCWSMSERRFLAFTHPHKSCPFNWIIFSSKCSPPTPSNLRGASDCKSIPNQK